MADQLLTSGDQASTDSPARPHLSISAHVVVQLGEELVTDMEQALLELAKNAYDADSSSCEIIAEPDWRPSATDPAFALVQMLMPSEAAIEDVPIGRVRIRDRGTGISEEGIERGWLKISSSVKRTETGRPKKTTKLGRTPVGDKGLGRLATMKIGHVLRMKTAVEGEAHWRTVTFSWRDFTQDRTLEEVPVLKGVDHEEPVDHHGTIIEIIGLHDRTKWADSSYIEQRLVPNLSALISPIKTDDEFAITVRLGDTERHLDHLDETVLNLAAAKFVFEWDGIKMTQKAFIAQRLFRGDRGDEAEKSYKEIMAPSAIGALIAWFRQDNKLRDRGLSTQVEAPWFLAFEDELPGSPFPQERQFPDAKDPGPFTGTLYYFLFHQDVKEKLVTAGVPASALQGMAQVALFRDGFRVRAQKDWLNLNENATRGTTYYLLRPANVIGYFNLTNSGNPELIEKSDREGFVDTPAHRGFITLGFRARDFANNIVEASRISFKKYRQAKVAEGVGVEPTRQQLVRSLDGSKQKASKALEKIQTEIANARETLSKAITVDNSVDPDTWQASREAMTLTLARATEALTDAGLQLEKQSSASQLIADIGESDADFSSRLLDAAAVGLAARTLSHELHNYVRQLRSGLSSIVQENRKLRNPRLTTAVRLLNGVTREFAKTIATIDPLLPSSRALKENINVTEFLREFVEARTPAAGRYDTKLLLRLPESSVGPVIRFNRTRLLQIAENLLQNSIYWLRQGPLPDGGRREVSVEVTSKGFEWSDSGPGIRPSLESSIFDAYVSDKPKAESSGLGLHVVSTFLELERCSIRLNEQRNSIGRRYKFEIDLNGAAITTNSF